MSPTAFRQGTATTGFPLVACLLLQLVALDDIVDLDVGVRQGRPHSKPSRTSVTSSFSRRSDEIVRFSAITTLSRSRRALALRLIKPG